MADMKITDFTARSELVTSDLLLVSDSSANYRKMQLSTLIAGLSDHLAKLGIGFFVCLTEAATAAKTIGAGEAAGYKPVRGAPFVVYFAYDVPANATLNINSTGAGDLWYRNAAITAGVIKGGDLAVLIYAETALEEKRYMVISVDRQYLFPSGGIPKTDMASAVQTSLGKADTAYQKPSGGIPKTDMASAVQTSLGKADTAAQPGDLAGLVRWDRQGTKTSSETQKVTVDSNGTLWVLPSGSGGSSNTELVIVSESGNDLVASKTSAQIYEILNTSAKNIVLIDYAGRQGALIKRPLSSGQSYTDAKFWTYDESNDSLIEYDVNSSGAVSSYAISLSGLSFYTKPSGGIPASDLAASAKPFIVNITSSNNTLSTDKTETEILAAVAANQVVLAKTPNGTGYYSYNNSVGDDGAEFIVAIATATERHFYRYVVDGITVSVSDFSAYAKPSGGIPESDLATAVKNKWPLRVSITWNGSNFVSDKTYAEVAAAETAGQPIDVSMDSMYGWFGYISNSTATFYAVDKDSNGYPLLYTFELTSSGITTSTKTLGDGIATTKTTVSGATPSIAAAANTEYDCGTLTSLTISSFPGTGGFVVVFTSGSTATTLSLPSGLKMPANYSIDANTLYELNVEDGRGVLASWATS